MWCRAQILGWSLCRAESQPKVFKKFLYLFCWEAPSPHVEDVPTHRWHSRNLWSCSKVLKKLCLPRFSLQDLKRIHPPEWVFFRSNDVEAGIQSWCEHWINEICNQWMHHMKTQHIRDSQVHPEAAVVHEPAGDAVVEPQAPLEAQGNARRTGGDFCGFDRKFFNFWI